MDEDGDSGFEFSYGERYPDRSNPKFDLRDQSERDRTHQPEASTRRNETKPPTHQTDTEPPTHQTDTEPPTHRNETDPSFRRNDNLRAPAGRRRSKWRAYAKLLWKLLLVVALMAALYFAFVTPGNIAFEPIHWYNVIVDTLSGWIIEWLKKLFSQWPA